MQGGTKLTYSHIHEHTKAFVDEGLELLSDALGVGFVFRFIRGGSLWFDLLSTLKID